MLSLTVFRISLLSLLLLSTFFGNSGYALDGIECRKTPTGRYVFNFLSNNGHTVSVFENSEAQCLERSKSIHLSMTKICTCYEKQSSLLKNGGAFIFGPLVYLTLGPHEFGVYCYYFDGDGNIIDGNGVPQLKIDGCVENAERAEKPGFTPAP